MRTFTTFLLDMNASLAWFYALHVPAIEAQDFLENDRRIICTVKGHESFQAALMHKGDGDFYININKERRQRLGLKTGVPFEITLEKDDSKYGAPMPEELETLLEMDELGNQYFHQLTPGKQRSLLYMVAKPKTSDTRLRKAVVIVDYLKANKGKLDYKALNQAFKDSVRR